VPLASIRRRAWRAAIDYFSGAGLALRSLFAPSSYRPIMARARRRTLTRPPYRRVTNIARPALSPRSTRRSRPGECSSAPATACSSSYRGRDIVATIFDALAEPSGERLLPDDFGAACKLAPVSRKLLQDLWIRYRLIGSRSRPALNFGFAPISRLLPITSVEEDSLLSHSQPANFPLTR
jgi:hypothetical protein